MSQNIPSKGPYTAWKSKKETGIQFSVNYTLVTIHEIQGCLAKSCMENREPEVQEKKEFTYTKRNEISYTEGEEMPQNFLFLLVDIEQKGLDKCLQQLQGMGKGTLNPKE